MKGHLKKVIVTALATLMLCALCLGAFVGCGSANVITVNIFCATSDANTNQTLIDAWIKEYSEEHAEELEAAGVDELRVEFTYNGDSGDYYDALGNRIAAGAAADIIYVSPRNIKSYAVNDIVLDLTNFVDWEKYGNGSSMWKGALSSFVYNEETNTVGETVTIKGNSTDGYIATNEKEEPVGIYAAPKDYSSFGLAYNKNFFTASLKDAYTNAGGKADLRPADGVFYWNGSDWAASDSYIKIGVTMKYYPYNFYRYDTYEDALADEDPIAELAEMVDGYEVTLPGWPGDTYQVTDSMEQGSTFDTSLGYVTYTYAEYSAMTYAVCWFAQIADREIDGTHTLMKWLNNKGYGYHTPLPGTYDNSKRNTNQLINYVYGNDQYEGSLYLAAWLLGNDTNYIDSTYTSVDARETWVEDEENWRNSNWVPSGNYDSNGDGLIDTFVTEDYGINSENFVEAYAAFLAYGSDWNGNSFYSGSAESDSSRGGFDAMLAGRCIFYGVGTWDLQQFNNTTIDKLNVGIMPTPVSEDYAIASKVKDYRYKAAYYSNDYTDSSVYNASGEWEKTLAGAQNSDRGQVRVALADAAVYDPYDAGWEISDSSMSSAWKVLMDARQDEWYARMDTVGFALNADILSDPEWKQMAAADLCAYLAMGEDAQVALTYSGSQLSSLIDQCEDYVFYQEEGYENGSFKDMITPDGIVSANGDNTLSVSSGELAIAKDYYKDTTYFVSDYSEKLSGMFQDTTLEGEEVWFYAVAMANYIYGLRANGVTIQDFAETYQSLKRFVNPYYADFNTGEFDAFGGRNAVYKCLNMVSVDYASRNLQVRMAAQNGRSDTSTYTYSASWIDVIFPYFKSTALLTYNTTRDSGALDLLVADTAEDRCIDLYNRDYNREATAQSQLTQYFRQITVSTGAGHFYTPATYCLTITSYVQYDLGANSLMEELQSMI